MRSRLVLSVLLSEQFLPSRVDVRLDGILSYRSDVSPLADSIAFCLLDDDPIDRLVDRAVAGDQLSKSLEEVLLLPRERDVFELVSVPIVCSE
ncbi:MAG: hypothetical protein J07HQW2_03805 [Haloquadratum walsbyi J07HQW2]|uniref:Uncharacterized protein n=1 Tax=Haloquadratum walsbyi J07HQW2 TaxID=1238425 RepID=U1N345_9EURY|nr:MAG: hypothetical protein J07HQW2_03805 [Haloquadratum walsbyi J07HQW2]